MPLFQTDLDHRRVSYAAAGLRKINPEGKKAQDALIAARIAQYDRSVAVTETPEPLLALEADLVVVFDGDEENGVARLYAPEPFLKNKIRLIPAIEGMDYELPGALDRKMLRDILQIMEAHDCRQLKVQHYDRPGGGVRDMIERRAHRMVGGEMPEEDKVKRIFCTTPDLVPGDLPEPMARFVFGAPAHADAATDQLTP